LLAQSRKRSSWMSTAVLLRTKFRISELTTLPSSTGKKRKSQAASCPARLCGRLDYYNTAVNNNPYVRDLVSRSLRHTAVHKSVWSRQQTGNNKGWHGICETLNRNATKYRDTMRLILSGPVKR
jgi:hypothetical protein